MNFVVKRVALGILNKRHMEFLWLIVAQACQVLGKA